MENLNTTEKMIAAILDICPGAKDIAPLGEGAWSRAFSFESDEKKYVLRWSRDRRNFDRDALAYQLFNSEKLPLPPIFQVGETIDLFYAVSELREGEFLESMPQVRFDEIVPSVCELLDSLRMTDLSKTWGYGFWDGKGKGEHDSWKKYLLSVNVDQPNRLTYRWMEKLVEHPKILHGFNTLYKELMERVNICPEERYLIHSDLINRNVLVDRNKISAVLDWGSSVFGDYLYDLAWFIYYEPWHSVFQASNLIVNLIDHTKNSHASVANMRERIACYLLHIGLDSIGYNIYLDKFTEAARVIDYTKVVLRKVDNASW